MMDPTDPGALAAPEPETRVAAAPPRGDRLFLRDLPFYARHGLKKAEQEIGQRFVVDVDWWHDIRPAAWADDVSLTVSYQDVYDHVRAAVETAPVRLIETLAERIAMRVLDHFAQVEQVRVVVHKPGAPITGVFGDVGVEIYRRR